MGHPRSSSEASGRRDRKNPEAYRDGRLRGGAALGFARVVFYSLAACIVGLIVTAPVFVLPAIAFWWASQHTVAPPPKVQAVERPAAPGFDEGWTWAVENGVESIDLCDNQSAGFQAGCEAAVAEAEDDRLSD